MCNSFDLTFQQADALLGEHMPFLLRLEEDPDNALYIQIRAAAVGQLEPGMLGELPEPVASVVSKCRPIQPTGRVIHIRFDDYILYQVRNESYAMPSSKEVRQGKFLTLYDRSPLLDYLSVSTNAFRSENGRWHPDPWKHYGIMTQNQIIDVISHVEPVLTIETVEFGK